MVLVALAILALLLLLLRMAEFAGHRVRHSQARAVPDPSVIALRSPTAAIGDSRASAGVWIRPTLPAEGDA
jgi:hypothetical protein